MPEALANVLRFSLEDIGLNRVEAFCVIENRAGMRVLEKVGMTREGVLREYLVQKGAFQSFGLYSLLRREYRGDDTDATDAHPS